MVYTTSNPFLIPKLIEMARQVPNTNIKALEKMLIEGMTSKDSNIIIDEKDDDVRGFIFATIESMEGEDCVFIQFCVIKPQEEERYIGFELLNKIRLWGKERGLKYLYMMTDRNWKPFARKYKFSPHMMVLKRKIVDEK